MSDEQTRVDAARRFRIRMTAWILAALVVVVYFGFMLWTAGTD